MNIRRPFDIFYAYAFCPFLAVLTGGMIVRLLLTGITGRHLHFLTYLLITPITCIALFFILRGIRAGQTKWKAEQTLVHKHPDTPWQWKEDWNSGYCAYSMYPVVRSLWCITALLCIVTALKVETFRLPPPADYFWVKMWPFFSGCLLLFLLTTFRTYQWSKFGTCALRLFSVPILPGKNIAGVIQTAHSIPMHSGYIVKLRCTRKNQAIYQQALRIKNIADVPHQSEGASIPLLIHLPDAMPDAREANWELMLYSQHSCFRLLRCKFRLPLFNAPASWSGEQEATPGMLQKTFDAQKLDAECFRR